ncbi:MAG: hypothetical protein JST06_02285 [Bacteroidetes bacterium]|nr:hypothetical protein [Bacteroidota bacterium]MBS1629342.1 hypothetical protein [Bacteroidota bacterium]
MSWNTVDDKHKKKYDRNFVACDEKYERDYIINTILEQFPRLSRASVEAAVDSCCKTIPAPRPRDKFLECLKGKLNTY